MKTKDVGRPIKIPVELSDSFEWVISLAYDKIREIESDAKSSQDPDTIMDLKESCRHFERVEKAVKYQEAR
jgi:hypothetical protein